MADTVWSRSAWLVLRLVPLAAFIAGFCQASAITSTVFVAGINATNWEIPDNVNYYQDWADTVELADTDELVFKYNKSLYSVLVVPTQVELDSCTYNASTYLAYDQSGTTAITFAQGSVDGYLYVMSSWFAGDCPDGMRFQILIRGTLSASPTGQPIGDPSIAPSPPVFNFNNQSGTNQTGTPEPVITIAWEPQTSPNWFTNEYPQLDDLTANSVVEFQFDDPFRVYQVGNSSMYDSCNAAFVKPQPPTEYTSLQRVDLQNPGDYFFIDANFTNCNSSNMKITWTVHGPAIAEPDPASSYGAGDVKPSSRSSVYMKVLIPSVIGGCVAVFAAGGFLVYYCSILVLSRRYSQRIQSQSGEIFGSAELQGGSGGASLVKSGDRTEALDSMQLARHKAAGHSGTVFSLVELDRATSNFCSENEVGRGGYGTVYKGALDNGTAVAIKRTKNPGADDLEQFLNEVSILSRVNNRNLVKLLGCCVELEVPLLVYEFISNGTLQDHLVDARNGHPNKLDWGVRFKIAMQTAEALKYLHVQASPPIFHRDVKSANILLDVNFNAKVADFGLSKLVDLEATHVSTIVKGTPGYLDPEYYHNFQVTDKTDVYSFGVVLLELITSKKPIDLAQQEGHQNLALSSTPMIKCGRTQEIIDPQLISTKHLKDSCLKVIEGVAQVATACLITQRASRPSMSDVVEMLQKLKGSSLRAEMFYSARGEGQAELGITMPENVDGPDFPACEFLQEQCL